MGRAADFLGGEERNVPKFISFCQNDTPLARAYEQAFPVTARAAKRTCKNFEDTASKRARRILKKHGVVIGGPPVVAQIVRPGEGSGVELPVDDFDTVEGVENYLKDNANVLTTEEEQIGLLNKILVVNRKKWVKAIAAGDDKAAWAWQQSIVNILQVLDPLKYRRGQEQTDSAQNSWLADIAATARGIVANGKIVVGGEDDGPATPPEPPKRIAKTPPPRGAAKRLVGTARASKPGRGGKIRAAA